MPNQPIDAKYHWLRFNPARQASLYLTVPLFHLNPFYLVALCVFTFPGSFSQLIFVTQKDCKKSAKDLSRLSTLTRATYFSITGSDLSIFRSCVSLQNFP